MLNMSACKSRDCYIIAAFADSTSFYFIPPAISRASTKHNFVNFSMRANKTQFMNWSKPCHYIRFFFAFVCVCVCLRRGIHLPGLLCHLITTESIKAHSVVSIQFSASFCLKEQYIRSDFDAFIHCRCSSAIQFSTSFQSFFNVCSSTFPFPLETNIQQPIQLKY